MKKKSFVLLFTLINLIIKAAPVDYVDMFIGQKRHSSCAIGPQLPHGSINPAPQTPNGFDDGYLPTEPIRGFGQLHVSGAGWGRYGQIFLSPQIGFNHKEDGHDSDKANEIATPYYYSVDLVRYGIKAEVAPTHNCAFYKFTYPKSDEATLFLDIAHNLPQHIKPEIGGAFLEADYSYNAKTNEISGWGKYRGGFGSGDPYKVYFVVKLGVKPTNVERKSIGVESDYMKIVLPKFKKQSDVNIEVSISMRSVDNAQTFLKDEIGTRSFDNIKESGKSIWNQSLGAIDVEGVNEESKKMFYTSLYFAQVMPRDRSGDDPYTTATIPHIDDHNCLWDTWRTKYPLMMLINEPFVTKSINSFIERYKRGGFVGPTYTSSLEWRDKQGGDDVDNVIVEAYLKGVQDVNWEKAFEVVKFHAEKDRSPIYQKYGWETECGQKMSVSASLEYAYNDYCAAQMAKGLGQKNLADKWEKRSQNWVMLFNDSLTSDGFYGFVAPRKEDLMWVTIDPKKSFGSWKEYMYEGNSWTYSLFVPHNFERLVEKCGGKEVMVERLKNGFNKGLIDMSNEPGFLIPFIFLYCDRADLTSLYVDKIRSTRFGVERGYPGNEDSGAMGAWYVFTSIGLFPNAGQDFYYIVAPQFEKSSIKLSSGKTLQIIAEGFGDDKKMVSEVHLNGVEIFNNRIKHSDIINGGELILTMSK